MIYAALAWPAASVAIAAAIHLLRRPRSFADQVQDDLEQWTAINT